MPKVDTNCSVQKTKRCASWDFIFHTLQIHLIVAMNLSDKLDKSSDKALCLAHMRQNKFFKTIFIVFATSNFIKSCEIFSENKKTKCT